MISAHLLPSRVRVKRPSMRMVDGVMTTTWVTVPGLESVQCRIDVGFFRPGKDFPLPPQAGRAPDRVAVYYFAPGTEVRPGDYLECISGPVDGTWLLRTLPDSAVGLNRLSHLEGQAVEVAPSLLVNTDALQI